MHISTDNHFSYPKPAFPVLQKSPKACKMICVDNTEDTLVGNLQAVVLELICSVLQTELVLFCESCFEKYKTSLPSAVVGTL